MSFDTITKELQDLLGEFKDGKVSLISVKIEEGENKEKLLKEDKKLETFSGDFSSELPEKEPRYCLLRYNKNIMFGYVVPTMSETFLKRVYHGNKNLLLDFLKSIDIKVDKKFEISSTKSLCSTYLDDCFKKMEETKVEISTVGAGDESNEYKFISDEAKEVVEGYKKMEINWAIFKLDDEGENIILDKKGDKLENSLSDEIDAKEPRFALYRYAHKYNEEDLVSTIYVYSVPLDSGVGMKKCYAANKHALLLFLKSKDVQIDKSVEESSVKSFTDAMFYDALHPKKFEEKVNFKRMKVKRRRPKKITVNL